VRSARCRCTWQHGACARFPRSIVEIGEPAGFGEHDFWLALAQAYRALAELLSELALSEETRRAVLTALFAIESEIEAWSEPAFLLDCVVSVAAAAELEEEPTRPETFTLMPRV